MKRVNLKTLVVIFMTVFFASSCSKSDETYQQNMEVTKSNSLKERNSDFKISTKEANVFALNFFTSHFNDKATVSIESTSDFNLPIENKKLFLVRLKPSGFILMSDDKRNVPVLAFSDNDDFQFSNFDELPIGAKEWISESLLLNLELEIDSTFRNDNDIFSTWNLYLPDSSSQRIIDPDDCEDYFISHVQNIYDDCMLETDWSQGLPYSLLTPICNSTGYHKPTGCVATSMAQIMNFWEHPNDFNWSILDNSYSSSDVSLSAIEVAHLMEDIGDKVLMIYGCNGSSASHILAKFALNNKYGYNNSITHDDYDISYICGNLISGYPVILGGYRTKLTVAGISWYTNGHSWVTDGLWTQYDNYKEICYTSTGYPMVTYYTKNYIYYLHMNWGWGNGSQENTWYFSNELTQPDNGTGYNYQWNKDMIINIHP